MNAPAFTIRPAEPRDLEVLLVLMRELAEYERLADQLQATPALMREALFGARPAAEALIAELEGEPAGYAIFFQTFSSFLARRGIWLEDVFVRPSCRRHGIGRGLLSAVAARAHERGGRLEWAALDWNELALGFYASLGAQQMKQWITHRLVGQELGALATQTSAP